MNQAKAQVAQAQAAVKQAQVNLDYTTISSPVDGVVVSRSVDVGQTVAASLQAPVLFTIANDLTKMQVNASVDEADIGNIADVEDVQFTVDAYPNRNFIGRIAEIRLEPTTVQNVTTYSVIINVDNGRLELKPGMTANISITVAKQDNVLRIPNAAMRYLPPGVTRDDVSAMLEKSGPANAERLRFCSSRRQAARRRRSPMRCRLRLRATSSRLVPAAMDLIEEAIAERAAPTRSRMAAAGRAREAAVLAAGRVGRGAVTGGRAETPQAGRLTERFHLSHCARTRADVESRREDSVSPPKPPELPAGNRLGSGCQQEAGSAPGGCRDHGRQIHAGGFRRPEGRRLRHCGRQFASGRRAKPATAGRIWRRIWRRRWWWRTRWVHRRRPLGIAFR